MKKRKKRIIPIILIFLCGVCVGIHRKVIIALLTGKELPEAPSWHFWVK